MSQANAYDDQSHFTTGGGLTVPHSTHHIDADATTTNEKASVDSSDHQEETKINEKVPLEEDHESEDAALLNDGNPFPPMPGEIEETQQLTVRAVVIGSLLGLVVGASNIYLGLKTGKSSAWCRGMQRSPRRFSIRLTDPSQFIGFTFGASLFGAIFGFAILKPLSHILPERFGGGYFGPKENCTVQTAATAAGGLTGLFVAAVPAMYQLKLLKSPKEDIGRLFLLTAITAFYGFFFAIPLRKYYIRE
jgi:hypothetical protein